MPGVAGWAPAAEISEGTDAYLVSAELPGVNPAEVEITFGDGLLTIQGERHAVRDTEGERAHRSERHYGGFRRSIRPTGADDLPVTGRHPGTHDPRAGQAAWQPGTE